MSEENTLKLTRHHLIKDAVLKPLRDIELTDLRADYYAQARLAARVELRSGGSMIVLKDRNHRPTYERIRPDQEQ